MGIKRRPPAGNVRRVAPLGRNLRYTVTGKDGQTVQCESYRERLLTLTFDRDPNIRTYTSQPERFHFNDEDGKHHTYIPDFKVWTISGDVEIHEVTLSARAEEPRIQARSEAARAICRERGWRYVVHTERTLPQATEEANLLALAGYRALGYNHTLVALYIDDRLRHSAAPVLLGSIVPDIMRDCRLPLATVVSAICHLLWHNKVQADLYQSLIFHHAAINPAVVLWLPIPSLPGYASDNTASAQR